MTYRPSVLLAAACVLWCGCVALAGAEQNEVRVARQYGISFLPLMIMEDQQLIEKRARAAGLPEVKTRWSTISGAAAVNDAMLSGNLDFASGGPQALAILWDRTRQGLAVKGVAGLNTIPQYLNTRNPDVKTIRDFTEKDKIALPSVKVSSEALALQMAAAKVFGEANYAKLDSLTVTAPHPEGLVALVSGKSEINSHFTTPPFAFQELESPGVHLVLNSDDIFGGPTTLSLIWTTTRFHDNNPKLYNAFYQALDEAVAFINRDHHAAATIYLKMTGDKKSSLESIEKMLANPAIRFTTTPQNVMKYADFMYQIGSIKTKPASWKELFLPEVHHLPGS